MFAFGIGVEMGENFSWIIFISKITYKSNP